MSNVESIEYLIRDYSQNYIDEVSVFGTDLKVLYFAESQGYSLQARKSYYRPCAEPFILSYWNKFKDSSISLFDVSELVSLLCGKQQSIRVNPVAGVAPDGSQFVFKAEPDSDWLYRVHEISQLGTFEAAAEIARHVLWNHPFTDGNGRLARALFYLPLVQGRWLKQPCLGLNGAFEVSRDSLALAFRNSIETRDLQTWGAAVEDAVRLAIGLASQGQQREGGKVVPLT